MLFRKNYSKSFIGISLIMAFLVVLSACANNNDKSFEGKAPVTVTFESNLSAASNKVSDVGPITAYSRTGAGDTLTLTSVKVLVKHLELETDIDDNDELEDSLEFESKPFVIEFNADTQNYTIEKRLPVNGTYDEVEVEIEGLDEDDAPIDTIFGQGNQEYSIVARGTYNGEEFLFHTDIEAELELELNPPIKIDGENPVNVDLHVTVADWFVNAAGEPIDPNQIQNISLIKQNIRNSFKGSNWEWDD